MNKEDQEQLEEFIAILRKLLQWAEVGRMAFDPMRGMYFADYGDEVVLDGAIVQTAI